MCSLRARWSFDAKYGSKQEALALIQEWVATVGHQAGLQNSTTSIVTGTVGVPESRIELEVTLSSMAALETLWAAIPPGPHRAWGERLAAVVVHGSPTWHVYREVPLLPPVGKVAEVAMEAVQRLPTEASLAMHASDQPSGLPSLVTLGEKQEEGRYILDWKGDRLKINPGDRLPGLG